MDSDLPGAEMPGAILDYVKVSQEKEKVEKEKEKEKPEIKEPVEKEEKKQELEAENKEREEEELDKIKKEIFKTFEKAQRVIREEDTNYYENKLVRMLQYDDSITQEMYEILRLSDPSKSKEFYTKLSTEKRAEYIGFIADIKIKENYEPDQFIIELTNGLNITYNKKYIRNKEDKKKKIEEIMEYFEKIKNNQPLYIEIELKEDYIGPKLIREPILKRYRKWKIWDKYKEQVLDKKEKYRLTYYEYAMCEMMGLNIFNLVGEERRLVNYLYIPRFLGFYPVWTPEIPANPVPFTHIIQLTPPATGKTQFALEMKNYFNLDYYDKFPNRVKLVKDAQKGVLGAVYKHDYIIIDEVTKGTTDEIRDFIKTVNTGLSSGEWVVEKGSYTEKGFYKPVGFEIFGNVFGKEETEKQRKVDEHFEGIDFKKFDNARDAAEYILQKGSKKEDYLSAVSTFIDRFAIASVVLKRIDLSKIGVIGLAPNPLELYALKQIIQERINMIAKEPRKYIDIDMMNKWKWKDGRERDNAVKIAIKLIAFEIDKQLNTSAEELAKDMVKGIWGWEPI